MRSTEGTLASAGATSPSGGRGWVLGKHRVVEIFRKQTQAAGVPLGCQGLIQGKTTRPSGLETPNTRQRRNSGERLRMVVEGSPSQCMPWPPGLPGTGTWCCWLQVSQRSPLSPGGQVQRPVCGSQWPRGHWQPAGRGVGRCDCRHPGMPASLHPAVHPHTVHSHTHACSPSPGAPSSQGHTRGTGVLWSLAGSDTDQSEGGIRSPRQLVHRHKGGNPGIAQSRSVLPVTHLIVKPCPAFSITLCQPWKPELSQAPQDQPKLLPAHFSTDQDSPLAHSLHRPGSSPLVLPVLRPTPSPTKQRSQR